MNTGALRRVGLVAGLLTMGCGSSGSSVDLPFEKDKAVKDLSADERQQLCKAGLEGLRDAYGAELCSLMGLVSDLAGEESCESARESCLDETFDTSSCEAGEAQPVNCDVTIGEVEACMNDMLALADDLMPEISCSSSLSDLQDIDVGDFDDLEAPGSCKAIDEQCEDLDLGMGNLGNAGDETS